MDIHGFHCVSTLSAESEEGFSTLVTHPDKTQTRGPFLTISEAVACAHAWNQEDPGAADREFRKQERERIEKALAESAAKENLAKSDPVIAESPSNDKDNAYQQVNEGSDAEQK